MNNKNNKSSSNLMSNSNNNNNNSIELSNLPDGINNEKECLLSINDDDHNVILLDRIEDKEIIELDEIFILLHYFNCTNITSNRTFQFIFLNLAIFTIYTVYSIYLEYIFNHVPGFKFGIFIAFCNTFIFLLIAGVQLYFKGTHVCAPSFSYALIGFLSITTIGLSNVSCLYLNYPTQLMFKSCKMIPVMLVGAFYFGKTYGYLDYIAITSLTSGMILFTMGNNIVNAEFPLIGVCIISIALLCDALIGNSQEKMMNTYKVTSVEMIFYSKMFGSIVLLVILFLTNEMFEAIAFCYENPVVLLFTIILSCIAAIGEYLIVSLITKFGALLCVVVTSVRKMVSLTLSFIIFPKPFTIIYLIGAIQVFAGIGLEIYLKNKKEISLYLNENKRFSFLKPFF